MKAKGEGVLIIVLSFALISMFGINIYQAYRYEQLQADVQTLQKEQEKWFEQNKSDFAALSTYSSPQHLKDFKDNLKLSTAGPGQTIIIKSRSGVDSNAEGEE